MRPRRLDGDPTASRNPAPDEVQAALDELEVRFLLDPETRFDTEPINP